MDRSPHSPVQPKCEHACKDGGSAPFYTIYEKDGGGWRTGRSTVICHTCFHTGVKPKYRGDLTITPVDEIIEGSLHVAEEKKTASQIETRVEVIGPSAPDVRDHDVMMDVSHYEKDREEHRKRRTAKESK